MSSIASDFYEWHSVWLCSSDCLPIKRIHSSLSLLSRRIDSSEICGNFSGEMCISFWITETDCLWQWPSHQFSFLQTFMRIAWNWTTFCYHLSTERSERAERAVGSIVSMLRRILVECENSKWISVLPWAVQCINSLPGLILPFSPHKIEQF